MDDQTLQVCWQKNICFIQINRPSAQNTINEQLIEEFQQVLVKCKQEISVIILEGLPEVFCFGADFKDLSLSQTRLEQAQQNPEPLYQLWLELATGPYVTIAHVRGKANAGGIGFVAACDIVLADTTATFSLSELLFGLFPACVLPFLIRKIGIQKANYMTLMTQPISVEKAFSWGLVDAYEQQSDNLIRKHLLRLRLLSKTAIRRYKAYVNEITQSLAQAKDLAVKANLEVFSDPENLNGIKNFIETGNFPWEKS